MTQQQRIEKRTKDTKRNLNKCSLAKRWEKFGFGKVVINGHGKCGGCYNPDDNTLEAECRECPYNEYFIEAVSGIMQFGA